MKNQIEIVKDIADGMIGIGGMPSNEEFYAEFDMRVRKALLIHAVVGQSEQFCSCSFVMIMRDVKSNVPFCSECSKEVNEQN